MYKDRHKERIIGARRGVIGYLVDTELVGGDDMIALHKDQADGLGKGERRLTID
jgi:hypothetical protein